MKLEEMHPIICECEECLAAETLVNFSRKGKNVSNRNLFWPSPSSHSDPPSPRENYPQCRHMSKLEELLTTDTFYYEPQSQLPRDLKSALILNKKIKFFADNNARKNVPTPKIKLLRSNNNGNILNAYLQPAKEKASKKLRSSKYDESSCYTKVKIIDTDLIYSRFSNTSCKSTNLRIKDRLEMHSNKDGLNLPILDKTMVADLSYSFDNTVDKAPIHDGEINNNFNTGYNADIFMRINNEVVESSFTNSNVHNDANNSNIRVNTPGIDSSSFNAHNGINFRVCDDVHSFSQDNCADLDDGVNLNCGVYGGEDCANDTKINSADLSERQYYSDAMSNLQPIVAEDTECIDNTEGQLYIENEDNLNGPHICNTSYDNNLINDQFNYDVRLAALFVDKKLGANTNCQNRIILNKSHDHTNTYFKSNLKTDNLKNQDSKPSNKIRDLIGSRKNLLTAVSLDDLATTTDNPVNADPSPQFKIPFRARNYSDPLPRGSGGQLYSFCAPLLISANSFANLNDDIFKSSEMTNTMTFLPIVLMPVEAAVLNDVNSNPNDRISGDNNLDRPLVIDLGENDEAAKIESQDKTGTNFWKNNVPEMADNLVLKYAKIRPANDTLSHDDLRLQTCMLSMNEIRAFRCKYEGCGKAYKKNSHLKAHMNLHTGFKAFSCDWPNCSRRFFRSDELTRHRRSHTGERKYVCPKCAQTFIRSDHLSKHARGHRSCTAKRVKDAAAAATSGGKTDKL